MLNILKLIFMIAVFSLVINESVKAESLDTNQNYLSKKEQAMVADYLNTICGDTFCGGEYDYENIGVFCNTDICSVYYDISPYSKYDFFSPEAFYQAPADFKYFSDSKIDFKIYKPRVFRDFYYGVNGEIIYFKNIKLTIKCDLKEIDYSRRSSSFESKKNAIYYNQLRCIDSANFNMNQLQSSFL